MTEQNVNTTQNETVTSQAPVQQPQPVAQPEPATTNVPKGGTAVVPPHVSPQVIDRLGKNKEFIFKDKNGYEWKYVLQYPGINRHESLYDEARMENGYVSNAKLHELYLREIVVEPAGLTVDDFDERPGYFELMNAVDTFLGERGDL